MTQPGVLTRSFALLVMVLAGCREAGQEADGNSGPAEKLNLAAFAEHFQLLDSIVLAQSDTAPVVRVSGVTFLPDGGFLLADASEGNVKRFDSAGRLLLIIGRKGDGPGEFNQPRFPRIGPDGRVFIADGMLGRVNVFDSSGTFLKAVTLGGLTPIMGFHVLDDLSFLVSAESANRSVLHLLDSTGLVAREFMAADRTLPRSDTESPFWRPLTQHWLAVTDDSAFLASTLSDSLWSIGLHDTVAVGQRLAVPGYVPPVPRSEVPRDFRELSDWQKSFHIAASVFAGDEQIAVPFVQGVLNYGDPMILAHRDAHGTWRAFSGAPPVIAVNGDTLITLEHPNVDPVVLGLYQMTSQ